MNPTHIEHIGIAVSNLESSILFYESIFGLKCYKIEEVADQRVRTAFFMVGQTKIELLESTDPEGPIGKFIEKKGEGIHHISLQVDQFGEVIQELKAKGLRVIEEADTKDFKAAFIHPRNNFGVLTEIIQPK